MPNKDEHKMRCSFCGKPQDMVYKLITGPGVCICDECVELCNSILYDEEDLDPIEKTKRKEKRKKTSLIKKINKKTALSKMKTNQYILSVLTANVTKDIHFFGQDEAHLLGDSNGQLSALGRNLNQMAKAMNQGIYEAYDRAFVGRIHEFIRAHIRHVYELLVQNKRRWE